jgi:hypothetical protein
MKKLFLLSMVLAVIPLSGCMTSCVIERAHNSPHSHEVKEVATGHVISRPAYPWLNYLLMPVTIPADIVTFPRKGRTLVSLLFSMNGSVLSISYASLRDNYLFLTEAGAGAGSP